MQRYFLEENYQPKEQYEITGSNYHHMVRVMRMDNGTQNFLVFKDGQTILAEIVNIDEAVVYLKELRKETAEKELPIQVTIACGFPKGDKLEWIVQKGTELGAAHFIGFSAKNSVVKWDQKKREKKEVRLQKIATEAAEQAHRQLIPTIQLVDKEQELIETFSRYDAVLVAYEESAKQGEHQQLAKSLQALPRGSAILVLFGPEGGFDQSEIALFKKENALLCGLGPRILRAETAPLYVLSAISFQFELM